MSIRLKNKRLSVKEFLFASVTLACSIIIVLFAAEFTLRIIQGINKRSAVYRHDNFLGWTGLPNATSRLYTGTDKNGLKLNSNGFNDIEFPTSGDGKTIRIAFIGDSFTAAYQVPASKTFARLAEKEINKRSPEFHSRTMNFGVPGYSTDQELLQYRSLVRKFKPDIAALVIFAPNDIADLEKTLNYSITRYKPRFILKDGRLELSGTPVPDSYALAQPPAGAPFTAKFKFFLKKNLVSYSYFAEKTKRLLLSRGKKTSGNRNTKAAPAAFWTDIFKNDPPQYVNDNMRLFSALTSELKKDCDKDGTLLLAFIMPIKNQVYPEEWKSIPRDLPLESYSKTGINNAIKEILTQHGIATLDLLPVMKKAPPESPGGQPVFLKKDGHLSEYGHIVVKDAVAGFIIREWKPARKTVSKSPLP